MKVFFLTGSIIFTVLILIIAFENMAIAVTGFQFLFTPIDSSFFLVLALSIIGIITGAFYTGLILSMARGSGQDVESGGNEW